MTQNHKTKKILWVDDSFVDVFHQLMAYEDELKYSGGFDIVKIEHPDKALDILEKGDEVFACIILDIMLPYGTRFNRGETEAGNKTGIILASKIRQRVKYKDVPIVLLTGVRINPETLAEYQKEYHCFFKADITAEKFRDEIRTIVGGNHE